MTHTIDLFFYIGANGRVGDRSVWANCSFKRENELNLPEAKQFGQHTFPTVFIRDETFPLTHYMMKPHDYKKKLEDNKRISNYRLSR